MFDLMGLRIRVASKSKPENLVSVEFSEGVADYADVNWPFQLGRWRTWGGGGHAHVAYYRFAETLFDPEGFYIEVLSERSVDSSLERGTLGRFRWSAARLEDPVAVRASLDSLLAKLDSDPWKKRLRKGLASRDIGLLMQLATEPDIAETQPSILLTTLTRQLMSARGSHLKSIIPAEDKFQPLHSVQAEGEQGTQYAFADDGTFTARGPNPAAEVTTLVVPAEAIHAPSRLLRLELLGSNDDVETSYMGRQRFVTIRELSVSQTSGGRSRNVLQRVLSDFPISYSFENAVDGDLETALIVPIPNNPHTLYLVLNQDLLSSEKPLEIKIATGGENVSKQRNPARIRLAITSPEVVFEDPFVAAEHLLTQLARKPSLDPLVHLQLARYYESSVPARSDDAIRHAMAANALLPESIVPSLALLDLIHPHDLIGDPPLRQIVREHLRRLQERQTEGIRMVRFRMALVDTILEKYRQGKFDQAEQLVWFGIASCPPHRKVMDSIFAGLPWRNLPAKETVESLSRGFDRYDSREKSPNVVAHYYNVLGLMMRLIGQNELALNLLDTALDVSPKYLQVHFNRGAILVELERFDEAEEQFRRQMEIDPRDPNPHAQLARVFFNRGRLDAAFAEFQKSAELYAEGVENDTNNNETNNSDPASARFSDDPARANQINGHWLATRKSFRLQEIEAVLSGAETTKTEAGEPIPTRHAVRAVEEGISYLQQVVDARPEKAGDVTELAIAHYRIGQWQQVVDRLEQVEAMGRSVGHYDRDRWHLFPLAMAHWRLGNKKAAHRYFGVGVAWGNLEKGSDKEHRIIRSEAATLMELDAKQQRQLKYEGFKLWLEELDEAIQQEPNDYVRWFYRGKVHSLIDGKEEKALADYSKAIELEPLDPDLRGWRAGLYIRLQRWEDALADRTRAIELQPWFSARYFERAETCRVMGAYHRALDDFEEGFRIDSTIDAHWFTRARARTIAGDIYLKELQQPELALKHFDEALKQDPKSIMALKGRADAQAKLKNHEQAIADIKSAIEVQPEDMGLFNTLANLHRARGDFGSALEAIESGLRASEGDVSQHTARAHAGAIAGDICLLDVKDYEKAVQFYDDSLDVVTDYFFSMRGRAHALLELGEYRKALESANQAIEIQPKNAWCIGVRAAIRRELGDLAGALKDRDLLIELEPSSNARYFERAFLLRVRGEHELALADIKKGFEVDSDGDTHYFTRDEAYILAGDIYFEDLDQPEKAFEQYEKALALSPENSEYQVKRDRAAKAAGVSTAEAGSN
ncbi:tetratricopeptide repeat protein [Stieleria sp. ICT_E10.1]|uniref:tetratricopeptide repeat protein n=1 Tax=Stieleria sedimenti TaxID=2976331 RepID=UPI00217FFA78|nr:tetratricopeptide repeat protein [Stieleria sedimenti]MCS7470357.1 tetratricopeptide repeat protein [Stieleria sedimenti]